MEKYYTITSAKRLDGTDNYGNVTDSVFFEGEQASALWKHAVDTQVTPGLMVYGVIEELQSKAGKPYRKFSKKQLPEDGDGGYTTNSSPKPSPSASGAATQRPESNGARQGMAINNAANYVIQRAIHNDVTLDPRELATEVQDYAKAIYKIDLSTTDQDIIDMMSE